MSHPVARRLAGLGLGTLAVLCAVPVLAADLAYPPYPGFEPGPSRIYGQERLDEEIPPPPPRRPVFVAPRFSEGPQFAPPPPDEGCRTIVRRRIDEDGEEVIRRVRVCEERPYPPGPRFRPSFYRPHPVPPADIPYGGPDDRWDGPPRW